MDVYLISTHSAVAAGVLASLAGLGIEPRLTLSLGDTAPLETCKAQPRSPAVVLVAFQDPQPAELSALAQICTSHARWSRVVAIGPVTKPQLILEAIRGGASDYLDLNGDLPSDLKAVIQRMQAVPGEQNSAGRLFTVVSPVGGTGASLLAVNLAAALAKIELPCGLLDLKLRGGDLATLLKASPRHTLLSLAEKLQHLDKAMFAQSLVKHECGIHLVASPEPFSDYRKINLQVIQRVLQLSRASCPNVVADLEDIEHIEQVRTLAESTQVLIPVRLDFVALYRTKKLIEHLTRSKVDSKHITLVASRTGQPNELDIKAVEDVLGMRVEHSVPQDAATVNRACNLGVPLVVVAPESKVAMSIIGLAASLTGTIVQSKSRVAGLKHLPLQVLAIAANLMPFNSPTRS